MQQERKKERKKENQLNKLSNSQTSQYKCQLLGVNISNRLNYQTGVKAFCGLSISFI